MNQQASFLLGVAVGAGIMYVLDPDRGTAAGRWLATSS